MTLVTAISRLTGLARVIVVAAALGTTFLANTYQTANSIPNLLFELVAAGVLTSVFVPTFIEYLVHGRRKEAWHAANVLMSVALVALIGLTLLLVLAAPLLMRLMTLGVRDPSLRAAEIDVGTDLIRLFAPQVIFYGAGMIFTGALHADRRFVLAAAAPILNNIIVIGVYLAYAALRGDKVPSVAGTSTAEIVLLGAGTTVGVAAMTLCLILSSGDWGGGGSGASTPGTRPSARRCESEFGRSAMPAATKPASSWCWCSPTGSRAESPLTNGRTRSSTFPTHCSRCRSSMRSSR